MKNADDMLLRIMRVVDQNNDGKIEYEGMKYSGYCLVSFAGPLYTIIGGCEYLHIFLNGC